MREGASWRRRNGRYQWKGTSPTTAVEAIRVSLGDVSAHAGPPTSWRGTPSCPLLSTLPAPRRPPRRPAHCHPRRPAHCCRITAHCCRITTHCCRITAHCCRITAHCCRITAHCRRITAHCCRIPPACDGHDLVEAPGSSASDMRGDNAQRQRRPSGADEDEAAVRWSRKRRRRLRNDVLLWGKQRSAFGGSRETGLLVSFAPRHQPVRLLARL